MKRGRSLLVLIAIPALVSLAVTLLSLTLFDSRGQQGAQVIVLPTHSGTAQIPPVVTQPPGGETEISSDQPTPEAGGCQNPVHIVTGGETLSSIAAQYGLAADDVIAANQAINPDFNADLLLVGQQLIIPQCGVPTVATTDTPSNTAVATRNVPTPIATATEVPPGTISVRIAKVLSPGDITREAVSILNDGTTVELQGWRIVSGSSKDFEFPAFRLYTGGGVTVFSGVGENTSINFYWGLTQALWKTGDTVTLLDGNGKKQSEYVVTP